MLRGAHDAQWLKRVERNLLANVHKYGADAFKHWPFSRGCLALSPP